MSKLKEIEIVEKVSEILRNKLSIAAKEELSKYELFQDEKKLISLLFSFHITSIQSILLKTSLTEDTFVKNKLFIANCILDASFDKE